MPYHVTVNRSFSNPDEVEAWLNRGGFSSSVAADVAAHANDAELVAEHPTLGRVEVRSTGWEDVAPTS